MPVLVEKEVRSDYIRFFFQIIGLRSSDLNGSDQADPKLNKKIYIYLLTQPAQNKLTGIWGLCFSPS